MLFLWINLMSFASRGAASKQQQHFIKTLCGSVVTDTIYCRRVVQYIGSFIAESYYLHQISKFSLLVCASAECVMAGSPLQDFLESIEDSNVIFADNCFLLMTEENMCAGIMLLSLFKWNTLPHLTLDHWSLSKCAGQTVKVCRQSSPLQVKNNF